MTFQKKLLHLRDFVPFLRVRDYEHSSYQFDYQINIKYMVSMTKTMYRSPYETPKCKLYSINVESVMQATSPAAGEPGGDEGYNDQGF